MKRVVQAPNSAACESLGEPTLPSGTRGSALTTLAAAIAVFLWASAFVAVKVAVKELDSGALVLGRYAIATLAFVSLVPFRGLALPAPNDLLRLATCGAIAIAFYNLALNRRRQTVDASVASMMARVKISAVGQQAESLVVGGRSLP